MGFFFMGITGIFFNFGLPHSVSDETILLASALKMLAEPTLTPAFETNYHMPLGVYIYLPLIAIFLTIFMLLGIFSSFQELTVFGVLNYAELLPIARFISVILGSVSIYTTYRIAQLIYRDQVAALASSFLLATSLMFIQLSHTGRVWIPQITVILLTLYAIVNLYYAKKDILRLYILSGLGVAASFGTHFIGILIYIPFFIVHLLRKSPPIEWRQIFLDRNFWMANGVICAALFLIYVSNPYGFNNYSELSVDSIVKISSAGINSMSIFDNSGYYARILFEYEPVLIILFLLSLPVLLRRHRTTFLLLGSFIVIYYLAITLAGGRGIGFEPRFISPVIPFLALMSGYGISYWWHKRTDSRHLKIKYGIVLVIAVTILVMPLRWISLIAFAPNTTENAREWIFKNIPNNAGILQFTTHSIPLPHNKDSLLEKEKTSPQLFTTQDKFLLENGPLNYSNPPLFFVVRANSISEDQLTQYSPDQFQYVMLAWWNYSNRTKALTQTSLIDWNSLELIVRFPENDRWYENMDIINNMRHPYYYLPNMSFTGPIIEIYKTSLKSS